MVKTSENAFSQMFSWEKMRSNIFHGNNVIKLKFELSKIHQKKNFMAQKSAPKDR